MRTINSSATLEAEIRGVAAEEVAIATNEGTYGSQECCRCVGTGDPAFGNYTIYQRVGGGEPRVVGCDPERAPGYRRTLGTSDLAARRRHLSDLRQQLREVGRGR